MKTKTFRYLGPDSAVSLRGGKSLRLLSGREVELPADSKFVRDLVAKKMLVPVEAPAAPAAPVAPAAPAAPDALATSPAWGEPNTKKAAKADKKD